MFKSGYFKRATLFKHRYNSKQLTRPAMIKEYNSLYEENKDLRVEAEEHIRKLRMGEVPWSPRLKLLRD